MDSSSEQRADWALKSRSFTCSTCGIDHATCRLAAAPFTVTLDAAPQSPSLRAAGGAVKPATPLSPKPSAPLPPNPHHSPAVQSHSHVAEQPAAAASSPITTSSAAAAVPRDYHINETPPATPFSAPATTARASNNRAPSQHSLQLLPCVCNRPLTFLSQEWASTSTSRRCRSATRSRSLSSHPAHPPLPPTGAVRHSLSRHAPVRYRNGFVNEMMHRWSSQVHFLFVSN